MGIPYYFSYLIKNHSAIISKLNALNNIHNLFIDSNSLIYDSLNFNEFLDSSQFEDYIIKTVIIKLEEIINIINPSENIYIAFDGVPPFAKINQQKNRRYKSSYQNKVFNKHIVWDTCAITPGTCFMNNLNNAIAARFSKKLFNSQNRQISVILSLSNEPGEGEHKLFNIIRETDTIKQKNNVIYGMDADLFMLALNHLKYTQNIYLYRETPLFINQLDKSLDPTQKYIININCLGNIIYNELTNELLIDDVSKSYTTTYYNKIEDYIFICFLLGNDFLPHFPALNIRVNGFTILLELYKKLFKVSEFLIVGNSINWNNFKKYIKNIAEHEETFIKEIYDVRTKQSKKFYPETNNEEIEFKFSCMPSWERNIENYINPYEEDWQHRYYYGLCAIDSKKNDYSNNLKLLCTNYLEILQWVYYYYSSPCKNWTLHFKYNYPPLLCDLYAYIPYFNSEFTMIENYNILNEKLLLCHVLPVNSLNLLPETIHNYLLQEYKDHYTTNYEIIYAFCKYFYEGHVQFPKMNIQEFNSKILKLL